MAEDRLSRWAIAQIKAGRLDDAAKASDARAAAARRKTESLMDRRHRYGYPGVAR